MSVGVQDSLLDLEKHRLQLEDNIKQLRKALQHWQTWDAEYEALKEEVDSVSESAAVEELHRIHDEFEGELLHGREIDDVFGARNTKSKAQILNVLERRIDYVTTNINHLKKQLEAAENKYAAATVLSQPDAIDENGEPITEIVENLDDDGNVLSYHLNKPGESLSHVREALEKAGINDLSEEEPAPKQKEPISKQQVIDTPAVQSNDVTENSSVQKKGVSFAEDTKSGDEPQPGVSMTAKRVEQIMKNAKEQENMSNQTPVLPVDEDPEDAAFRQDMLRYGMGEVGAVVAELELDDGDSGIEDDDGFDYVDEDFDEDDEDFEEDKYGRSKGRVVTDDYRQRMLELEQKLGIKSRFTEDSANDATIQEEREDGSDSDDGRIGRITVDHGSAKLSSASKPTPSKSSIKNKSAADGEGGKGVRFASALDVASHEDASAPAVKTKEEKAAPEPLSEVVVERSAPAISAEPKSTRKPSRFRKAREEPAPGDSIPKGPLDAPPQFLEHERPSVPTGPDGTTIADKLVERDTSASAAAPGDLDDSMAHHEVADEYQRMRKKFIQRDGGFLREDESPIQLLDESEGGPERISRFKAARLSRY